MVRFAFQRALFVSAGIPYFNVEVALPDQETLCGSVNVVNTGGWVRRSLQDGEAEAEEQHSPEELSLERIIEAEQRTRRGEVFGVTDFAELRTQAAAALDKNSKTLRQSRTSMALRPDAVDTNVFFSLVSNVPGESPSEYIQRMNLL